MAASLRLFVIAILSDLGEVSFVRGRPAPERIPDAISRPIPSVRPPRRPDAVLGGPRGILSPNGTSLFLRCARNSSGNARLVWVAPSRGLARATPFNH